MIKSYRKGDQRLADIVYSGVPAAEFGLEQVFEIGPMSGKSNVIYWLEKRGISADETRVNRIYERAKSAHGVLEEHEMVVVSADPSSEYGQKGFGFLAVRYFDPVTQSGR